MPRSSLRQTMVAVAAMIGSLLPVIALPTQRASAAEASDPIITVAGNGLFGANGDGGRATDAQLNHPAGVAADRNGNLFIADTGNNLIRKVDNAGRMTTVAGTPNSTIGERTGFATATIGEIGDGGPATQALLNAPNDVAVDGSGNLFIADTQNFRIRKVDAAGTITTVAGTGPGLATYYGGDGGPATAAQISNPRAITVDHGNLYIADTDNARVRKVDSAGIITTVAGNGQQGYSGDGGPATSASLFIVYGTTLDSAGNLYIADDGGQIRKVDTAGIITTVAGQLNSPADVAVDGAGNLLVSSFNNLVGRIDPTGNITTLAGGGGAGYSGDGGPASAAQLSRPWGIDLDASGALFIADMDNNRVRRVGPDRLALTMAHSPEGAVGGQTLTYTLDVRTFTGGAATGVTVTDPVPPGTTFSSASASQGSCAPPPTGTTTVSCALGDMAAAATARVTITVTVAAGGATVTNTATVGAKRSTPIPPTTPSPTSPFLPASICRWPSSTRPTPFPREPSSPTPSPRPTPGPAPPPP